MSSLSTHVLDAVSGLPASGVAATLFDWDGKELGTGVTDRDGRIANLADDLAIGNYRLRFATGEYFAGQGVAAFYPEVSIAFTIAEWRHHHVPLLLSPFAYSTYRGS
ncbi:hydroxyisourate hydrolase [Nocardia sp. NPDC005978]|uniref:hydroxyisourate hydrolase n=1 Tax=unclassified Nocardia TaxID=2637762 RepID=UPI0033A0AB7C